MAWIFWIRTLYIPLIKCEDWPLKESLHRNVIVSLVGFFCRKISRVKGRGVGGHSVGTGSKAETPNHPDGHQPNPAAESPLDPE